MDRETCVSVGVLSRLMVEGHISEKEYEERMEQLFQPGEVARPTLIHNNKRSDVYSPYDLFDDSPNQKTPSHLYSVYSLPETDIPECTEIISCSNEPLFPTLSCTWRNNIITDTTALISTTRSSFTIPKEQKRQQRPTESFTVSIIDSNGESSQVFTSPADFIKSVKAKYLQKYFRALKEDDFVLFCNGEELDDEQTLESADIESGNSLYIKTSPFNYTKQNSLSVPFGNQYYVPGLDSTTRVSALPSPALSFVGFESPKFEFPTPPPLFPENVSQGPISFELSPQKSSAKSKRSRVKKKQKTPAVRQPPSPVSPFGETNTTPFATSSPSSVPFSFGSGTAVSNFGSFDSISSSATSFGSNVQSHDDPLDLQSILQPHWYSKLSNILNRPDIIEQAKEFIGRDREWMIPSRENTFKALCMKPEDYNVVIFGQDPYPREASATGIAFYDGEVQSWKDKLSPSQRNIIKSAMMSCNMAKSSDTIATLRKTLASQNIVSPPEWFEYLMSHHVLWLNTALTFSGKEKSALDRHTKFWAPIVEEIVQAIIEEKNSSSDPSKKKIVFALWGGNAQKLSPMIQKISKKFPGVSVMFAVASHPCTNSFCGSNPCQDINDKLVSLGLPGLNWAPRKTQQ